MDCNLKVCELQILDKQFDKLPACIKIYEKVAKKYLSQAMLRSSAADHLFNACLSYIAHDDLVGAKKQMQVYCIDDSHFDGSLEHTLISSLLEAIADRDYELFQTAMSEYNTIKPFDKLRTSLMV